MYLSIIIPTFNENKIIEKNLNKIINYFSKKIPFEVILINDGSTDNTKEIINNFKFSNLVVLNNPINLGKGAALKLGFKKSKGDMVLIVDADLSTSIEQFDILYKKYLEGYNIVIGSRSTKDANVLVKQGILRILAGKIFNLLIKLILGINFKDTQCGFKLFDGIKARKIMHHSTINKFCIDVEILFLAKKFNLKVYEIGITWKDDKESSVNLIRDSFNMFLDLIRIRFKKIK